MLRSGRKSLCGKILPASVPASKSGGGFYASNWNIMIEPEEFPENDAPQVTTILQSGVGNIHADVVRMSQSDAETITAEEIELRQSAAANVKADKLSATQSGLAFVQAEEVKATQSGLGMVQAGKMSVSGYTGVVTAGSAEVHNAMVGFVAGRDVHVNESRTGILFARTVNGNVNTVLDTRGALIAGLTGGLFAGLMLLLGRMLFRRK